LIHRSQRGRLKLDRRLGKGYAREACRALIGFAFQMLRLAWIVTITHRENTPSIRLLERLGMRLAAAPNAWPDMLAATLENDLR